MNEFADSLDRLLADVCTPAFVRQVDRGGSPATLWTALEQSGFLDAMVAEGAGGAGLPLAGAFELFVLQGRYAVPVPMARTMAARALGSEEIPLELGAVVVAGQIVGALERTLEMTLAFANDRVQFGRPIGKFQAIQHQLAVMAEQVAAARMAAQVGCQSAGALPHPARAAVAKSRASEAAGIVAPMAHAIHGAIGITAELDLQLFTRRLHLWRAECGSETFWNRQLGGALLASDAPLALDYLRAELLPSRTFP